MNFKQQQITELFTKFGKELFSIWLSGKEGEGEYKTWYSNGQIMRVSFWKNNKLNGEFKSWSINGKVKDYALYKDGKRVKDFI